MVRKHMNCTVIYPDPNVVDLLVNNFVPQIDFYKTFYCEPLRNPNLSSLFITSIRLEIQKRQIIILLGNFIKIY